uniref:SPRY domain-containing protein n=1 Tax=Timema douglasi TaxID=61478 RepID=A0A7R8ZBZ0_TIMDO|nr:unnamed protein product [Timema douglasi]
MSLNVFCCLRNCLDGFTFSPNPVPRRELNPITLDTNYMGVWGVGLATRMSDLNRAPGGSDDESWVLCSDAIIRHSNKELAKISPEPQEGDILGVAYDHVELNFYVNGKSLESPVSGIRGSVYPALYVDDGAILDIVLTEFNHEPPPGFDRIMLEQSLL